MEKQNYNWFIAGAFALTFFACGGDGDPVYGRGTKGAGAAGAAGSSHTGGGKGTSGGLKRLQGTIVASTKNSLPRLPAE